MLEIPLFPLNIVAFPGESINLHIFEPRYKQLIRDCLDNDLTFGIPSYVLSKIEMGTEVRISEVSKVYPDERMDIKTEGLRVFEVTQFKNPWRNKLYAGGEISFKEEIEDGNLERLIHFKELVSELFRWLGEAEPDMEKVTTVFDIGHKIGLRPEEEYQLIVMRKESDRLEFAIRHLNRLIPALERAQQAQDRIKQNGHFKHLDPLKF
jgi:hypothetical protein